MTNMGEIIAGISIGDEGMSAYLNLFSNQKFGNGLFDKATLNEYRKNNMRNNAPRMASYYSVLQNIKPTESKRYLFGDLVSAYNVDGIPIGYAYTTDINERTLSRGITSVSDFDRLQSLLRLDSLKFNDVNNYKEYTSYRYDNVDLTVSGVSHLSLGDIYTERTDNYRRTHNSLKESSPYKELYSQKYKVENIDTSKIKKYNEEFYIIDDLRGVYFLDDNKQHLSLEDTANELRKHYNTKYNAGKDKSYKFYKVKFNEIKNHLDYEDIEIDNVNGRLTHYDYSGSSRTYLYYDEKGVNFGDNADIDVNINSQVQKIQSWDDTSKLLSYTNNLFKKGKIKSIINRFGTGDQYYADELITAQSKHGLSRGRNLLAKEKGSNGNPYCRVWTALNQYSKMKHRIKGEVNLMNLHSNFGTDLRPGGSSTLLNNHSILQSNGFLRITPTIGNPDSLIKQYMFSIENLAWKDSVSQLTREQTGPKDGRIMWFPPYNLKFTENINVNWNGNNFIGRGEQIYTYTNTERSGTLSFSLLIDHPSILNKWRGQTADYTGGDLKKQEEKMLRFFAGCEKLEINNEKEEEKAKTQNNNEDNRNMQLANDSTNSSTTPDTEATTKATLNKNPEPVNGTSQEYTYVQNVDINNYTYDNEYLYFSEMSNDEYFVKNITNRIKHFDPAFHSITPEGFNARLTFLQQCTRQGPTSSASVGGSATTSNFINYAGNLSFGRAPYCILRIGDFFNTKILIDSISIDYDNGSGTQWDLNPEGIGVQPMFANINLNFKFVGGQDITGPVEQLQNAVSSNYYANTSIYTGESNKVTNQNGISGFEKNITLPEVLVVANK